MITKILKLKTAWIAFFVALIASFIMVATAKAEDDLAKKYNVTFPITELNNCSNIAECRSFCEDPVNQNTCIAFAKKKGFYKEPEVVSKKDEIVAAAKRELGCASEASCRVFCSDSLNFDKCDAFAKRKGLTGGRVGDPTEGKILEKAKEILGCSSPDSCVAFCSDESNRQKCSEFAKEVGLRGGEQRVGPGGCTSEETCKAFCSDPNNFQVCKGFTQSSGGRFTGPGGCNSEETCRTYCREHENECRSLGGLGGSPLPGYNPQEMCLRTPNCKWENNTCQCGFYGGSGDDRNRAEEYAKFCRENPDKCRPGQTGGFSSERERREFEDYCIKNSDKCRPPGDDGGRYQSKESQEATCKSGGGTCDWSSGFCSCRGYRGSGVTSGGSGSTTSSTPPPSSNPSSNTAPAGMSRDQQEAGCKSCGGTCNWNGDTCQCQCASSGSGSGTTSTPAPVQTSAPAPAQTSAPQTTSSTPPPSTPAPAVQGISIVRSIIDRILDLFR